MRFIRISLLLLTLTSLCLLQSCSNAGAPSLTVPLPSQWVVAWGVSPQNALPSTLNTGGSEQSFRFLVYPSVGGVQERVHFSNYFGTTPITIGAARLAVASSGDQSAAIDSSQNAGLTFNGSKSITLQPNQEIDSDPVNVTYSFGEWLAVSVYMQGAFPALTEHNAQVSNNFFSPSGAGDVTNDIAGRSFTTSSQEWFLVTSVEAYGPFQGTVAFFGSSSVDGHASNYGDTNSYPVSNVGIAGQNIDRPTDWLARSLQTAGYSLGVVNAGLLADPAGHDANTANGSVLSGIDRFQHDVVQQPGIKAVVIYIGGIDLRGDCLTATTIEGSLSNIIAQANSAGIRVILATLPPSEYCLTGSPLPSPANPFAGDLNPGPENSGSTQRRALNTWIRSTAAHLPGVAGVADFDAVLAYPAHPDFIIPNLNSGDNFHPNGAGYGIQNSAIPLKALLGY